MNPIEIICNNYSDYVPCIHCQFNKDCSKQNNYCNDFIKKIILDNIKSYYDDWELT